MPLNHCKFICSASDWIAWEQVWDKSIFTASESYFPGLQCFLVQSGYLTIRPVAHKGKAKWAVDPWPLGAEGVIVLVSSN